MYRILRMNVNALTIKNLIFGGFGNNFMFEHKYMHFFSKTTYTSDTYCAILNNTAVDLSFS